MKDFEPIWKTMLSATITPNTLVYSIFLLFVLYLVMSVAVSDSVCLFGIFYSFYLFCLSLSWNRDFNLTEIIFI